MGGDGTKGENGATRAAAAIAAHLADISAARPSLVLANGLSPKGAKTLRSILAAAHAVFVRDGHAGLSMRKVADEAGVALGNVNYYFGSKSELLEATLREALTDYVEAHLAHIQDPDAPPLDVLLNVVAFYVANGRQSHPLFFQIWGYAASDGEARKLVRELYRPIGRFIYYLVRGARPDASDQRIREIVLQLFSLEEGAKLFVGIGPDDNAALRTAEIHITDLARRIVIGG